MSPEFSYDPSTGEGFQVGPGGQPIEEGPSSQELADIHQARSIENTARHLTQRQNNISDLGANPNLEAEAELQQLQAQLFAGDFANPIEEQILLQKCEQLAQTLVGGVPFEEQTSLAPSKSEGQQYADQLAEEDPQLLEALNNAADVLETSAIENVNAALGSDDPIVVAAAADAVRNVTSEMVSSGAGSQLDHNAISFFNEYAGEEISNDINTLTAAVVSGAVSRADAMQTAMRSPRMMQAMMAAAADPNVNFKLAL